MYTYLYEDDGETMDYERGLRASTPLRVSEVVEAAFSEDLGSSLEPDRLGDRDSRVLGEKLRGEASECAKHSPAGVDDFGLTVGSEGGRISGKALGVPSVVSRELTGKVGRNGTLGERAEPESTVRTVPFLAGGTANLLAGDSSGDLLHGHTLVHQLVGDGAGLDEKAGLRVGVEKRAAGLGGDALAGKAGDVLHGVADRGTGRNSSRLEV